MRPAIRFPSLFSLAPALVLLAGCSDAEPGPSDVSGDAEAREFSQADKVAARALSIGDAQSLEALTDPDSQAQLCSTAIAGIAVQLREAGGLTETQLAALQTASEFYARQVPPSQSSPDTEDSATMPQVPDAASEAESSGGADARIAIACLRRLQESEAP